MKPKKMLLTVIVIFGLLIAAAVIAGMSWPRINDVTTGDTPEYPQLQPQTFKASTYQVFDAALAVARDLGWQEIVEDRANGTIHALETTRLFRFSDDITITIKPDGQNVAVVMRSRSRVGKGDFGTNARRIKRFQQELVKRL